MVKKFTFNCAKRRTEFCDDIERLCDFNVFLKWADVIAKKIVQINPIDFVPNRFSIKCLLIYIIYTINIKTIKIFI